MKAAFPFLKSRKKQMEVAQRYAKSFLFSCDRAFIKADRVIKEQKLFLDSQLSINSIAKEIGSNRTYISKGFSSRYGTFREYITDMRVDHFVATFDVRDSLLEDCDDYACRYGFRNARSLNRALLKKVGKTYAEIRSEYRKGRGK